MRNAANKMTKSINPYTENLFFRHLLKYLSEMDLSVILTPALFDYHWLRRALHGALHRSCVAIVSSEGALYVIMPYDYPAAPTF